MNASLPADLSESTSDPQSARSSKRSGVSGGRLAREQRTMRAVVECYCHAHHGTSDERLCQECQGLLDYSAVRLQRCRFGAEKPTCANCPVHCYQSKRREQVKTVMRFSGPRMLWQHPILAAWHWLDSFRRTPEPSSHGEH